MNYLESEEETERFASSLSDHCVVRVVVIHWELYVSNEREKKKNLQFFSIIRVFYKG